MVGLAAARQCSCYSVRRLHDRCPRNTGVLLLLLCWRLIPWLGLLRTRTCHAAQMLMQHVHEHSSIVRTRVRTHSRIHSFIGVVLRLCACSTVGWDAARGLVYLYTLFSFACRASLPNLSASPRSTLWLPQLGNNKRRMDSVDTWSFMATGQPSLLTLLWSGTRLNLSLIHI